ncbi:two-component system response regulator [Microbacterium arborescens]|uniref:Transcriptional regulatory protein n=2 Tax=Microbacterium TaxID=33882 RepID=A0ABU1I0S7_9MICO|nr:MULTISPECIES: response regulator [Microbacterium]APF33034.1 two-component system response regulator [Microbacterium paludicola]MDR6166688.1 response regulator of citrate/malate metabolism [Microbacterium paludicola]OAZ43442.1 two-component system response regulator [Microbacterium arborescens]POX66727.1 two-component system response regulator [Microbacterium sp. Ru50]
MTTTDPLRVLVVDDDFRVAGLHRDAVDAVPGFRALEPARSVAAARSAIAEQRPDLVLVDNYLPDGEGVELVRSIDVDAIVLSAAADAETVRRALRAGAVGYLIKPFEARALRERLERYARYRNVLDAVELEQDDVDRALSIVHGGPATTTRSATEQMILTTLGSREASAGEIAAECGISRATAQRHLATMAGRGVVEVRLRYGSTGRPEHRYAVSRG